MPSRQKRSSSAVAFLTAMPRPDASDVAYASGGNEKRAVALIRNVQTHQWSSLWCLPAGFEAMTFADGRFVLDGARDRAIYYEVVFR